jgi:hypothetical protein
VDAALGRVVDVFSLLRGELLLTVWTASVCVVVAVAGSGTGRCSLPGWM